MDVHITIKTNKYSEVVYVNDEVRQLFSIHRVINIVSSIWRRAVQAEKNVVCCAVM